VRSTPTLLIRDEIGGLPMSREQAHRAFQPIVCAWNFAAA
jgi:hypothetical protein